MDDYVLAHRAEQRSDESAVPARPHHQQVGILGGGEKRVTWGSFECLPGGDHVLVQDCGAAAPSGLCRGSGGKDSLGGSAPSGHTSAAP